MPRLATATPTPWMSWASATPSLMRSFEHRPTWWRRFGGGKEIRAIAMHERRLLGASESFGAFLGIRRAFQPGEYMPVSSAAIERVVGAVNGIVCRVHKDP